MRNVTVDTTAPACSTDRLSAKLVPADPSAAAIAKTIHILFCLTRLASRSSRGLLLRVDPFPSSSARSGERRRPDNVSPGVAYGIPESKTPPVWDSPKIYEQPRVDFSVGAKGCSVG